MFVPAFSLCTTEILCDLEGRQTAVAAGTKVATAYRISCSIQGKSNIDCCNHLYFEGVTMWYHLRVLACLSDIALYDACNRSSLSEVSANKFRSACIFASSEWTI